MAYYDSILNRNVDFRDPKSPYYMTPEEYEAAIRAGGVTFKGSPVPPAPAPAKVVESVAKTGQPPPFGGSGQTPKYADPLGAIETPTTLPSPSTLPPPPPTPKVSPDTPIKPTSVPDSAIETLIKTLSTVENFAGLGQAIDAAKAFMKNPAYKFTLKQSQTITQSIQGAYSRMAASAVASLNKVTTTEELAKLGPAVDELEKKYGSFFSPADKAALKVARETATRQVGVTGLAKLAQAWRNYEAEVGSGNVSTAEFESMVREGLGIDEENWKVALPSILQWAKEASEKSKSVTKPSFGGENIGGLVNEYVNSLPLDNQNVTTYLSWLESKQVDTNSWTQTEWDEAKSLYTEAVKARKGPFKPGREVQIGEETYIETSEGSYEKKDKPFKAGNTFEVNGVTYAETQQGVYTQVPVQDIPFTLDLGNISKQYSIFETEQGLDQAGNSPARAIAWLMEKGAIPREIPAASVPEFITFIGSLIGGTGKRLEERNKERERLVKEQRDILTGQYEVAVSSADWKEAIRLRKEIRGLGGGPLRSEAVQASILQTLANPVTMIMAQRSGLLKAFEQVLGFQLEMPDWSKMIKPVGNVDELMRMPEVDRAMYLAYSAPQGSTPQDFLLSLVRASLQGPTQAVQFVKGARRG